MTGFKKSLAENSIGQRLCVSRDLDVKMLSPHHTVVKVFVIYRFTSTTKARTSDGYLRKDKKLLSQIKILTEQDEGLKISIFVYRLAISWMIMIFCVL